MATDLPANYVFEIQHSLRGHARFPLADRLGAYAHSNRERSLTAHEPDHAFHRRFCCRGFHLSAKLNLRLLFVNRRLIAESRQSGRLSS